MDCTQGHRNNTSKTQKEWREPAKPAINQPFTGKINFRNFFKKIKK